MNLSFSHTQTLAVITQQALIQFNVLTDTLKPVEEQDNADSWTINQNLAALTSFENLRGCVCEKDKNF